MVKAVLFELHGSEDRFSAGLALFYVGFRVEETAIS